MAKLGTPKKGGMPNSETNNSMEQSPSDQARFSTPFTNNSGPSTNEFMQNVAENITIKNIIILVLVFLLILSFLGVNLLIITGNMVQFIVAFIGPFVNNILSILGYTAGSIINVSADAVTGTAKTGIDIADGTVHSVGNLLRNSSNVNGNLPIQQELNADILGPGPIVLPEQPLAEPNFTFSPQLPQLPNIDFIPPPEFIITQEVEKLTELSKLKQQMATPSSSAMGPSTNAMGPSTNAMGPSTNAMGPSTNAMGPSTNAMGPSSQPDLDTALNTSNMVQVIVPENDSASSPIQNSISSNASSWCLVGEYQGRRGCVQVNNGEQCLSGQTFDNEQMCTASRTSRQPPSSLMQQSVPRMNGTAAINWGIPPPQSPPGSVFNPGSIPPRPMMPFLPPPPPGYGIGFNNVPPLSYNQPLIPGYNGMPPPGYPSTRQRPGQMQ